MTRPKPPRSVCCPGMAGEHFTRYYTETLDEVAQRLGYPNPKPRKRARRSK